jgi:hypothetical protein
METLAIIAYRQPISKSETEHIRGVSCDYAIQKLLEKELIEITGKSDGPGRPVLYSTSRSFMDYFGIKSVKDLPQLKDIHVDQNEIGRPTELSDEQTGNTDISEAESDMLPVEEISEVDAIMISEEVNINNIQDEPVQLNNEEGNELGAGDEPIHVLNEEEESAFFDSGDTDMELPDRRSIFIENEKKEIGEESEETDREDNF